MRVAASVFNGLRMCDNLFQYQVAG